VRLQAEKREKDGGKKPKNSSFTRLHRRDGDRAQAKLQRKKEGKLNAQYQRGIILIGERERRAQKKE